ncbi:unnamed protein product [Cunninghamella echinulata]
MTKGHKKFANKRQRTSTGKFVKKIAETQSNNESAESFDQDWIDEDIEIALESAAETFNDSHLGIAVSNSIAEEKISWLEHADKKFKRAYTGESDGQSTEREK